MILTIRTDQPEAEVGIFTDDGHELSYYKWLAHRELSNTLLKVISLQLKAQKSDFIDLTGLVVFCGPGSFTGLRIGITVANTLAYGLGQPIVGTSGVSWLRDGLDDLQTGRNDKLALPNYGAEAHITQPKK